MGDSMSDSPESLVRKFFAAWADPEPDELGSFFYDAAVWVDGPQVTGPRYCSSARESCSCRTVYSTAA